MLIDDLLYGITKDCEKLAAAIRAKGHEIAGAHFSLDRHRPRFGLRTGTESTPGAAAFVTDYGGRYSWAFIDGDTYGEALTNAFAEIERMEMNPAIACEAWFSMDNYREGEAA